METYSRGRIWLGVGAILACTLLAYLPALQGGYVWDDDRYVTDNLTLRSVEGLARIWGEIGAVPQYYPIVHTTFWVEYHLWGLEPLGYHLDNVLLHACNALLLWFVLRRLGLRGGWFAALIFALHPVHVESVAWITERKNVLSAFFYFLSLLAYMRFNPLERFADTPRRRWGAYALALVLFTLALLSKTVACSLPAVILLLVWWKRGRIGKHDVAALVPWFLIGLALALLTIAVEKVHVGAEGEIWAFSFLERCLIAGRAVWFYAAKLVWPAALTFVYPRWSIDASVGWQYVFPLLAIMCVSVLWLLRRRAGRGPLVAVLIFVGTLVPALGFFNVYPMKYSFVADHFQYLASAGLIALACVLGARILAASAGGFPLRATLVVALAAVLGSLTWQQSRIYESAETLWRDTIAKNSEAWMAHHNLARILIMRGDDREAMESVRRTLDIKPDHAAAHINRGVLLLKLQRIGAAEEAFRTAIELDSNSYPGYFNLGKLRAREGDLAPATSLFREAIELKPELAEPRLSLAEVYLRMQRMDAAEEQFRAILLENPDHLKTLRRYGLFLLRRNRFRDAIEPLRRAISLDERSSQTHVVLATALDSLGQREEALVTARRALELARESGNVEGAEWLRQRFQLSEEDESAP